MTLSFFRRHRKMFMVVMFAALVGMMFFGSWSYMGPKMRFWWGGGPGSNVIGAIGGKSIKERDANAFFSEMAMAGQASQFWAALLEPKVKTPETQYRAYRYTLAATAWPLLRQSFMDERPLAKSVLVWMALYEEARKAGFDTSPYQVVERLKGLEDLGLPKAAVDRIIAQSTGGNRDIFYTALRRDMTLAAYLDWLIQSFGEPVTPQLKREFAKMDDRIQVRLAVMRAEDYLADVKDIPEADLKAQFEKYKAYLPGKGPDGYGYRIPDRVKVEYLAADPKGFEAEVASKVTDEDVRKYYEDHKDPEFLVKEEAPAGVAPPAPAGDSPSAPPAAAPSAPPTAAPSAPATEKSPAPAAPAKAPAITPPAEKPAAGPKGEAGATGPVAPAPAAPKAETKAASAAPAKTAPVMLPPSLAPTAPAAPVVGPGAGPPAPPVPPAAKPPEKKFKPLAEVAAEIRSRLVAEAAKAAAMELMGVDVGEIRQQKKPPDMRIWADGKKVKHFPPTPSCTAADLALLPGIGHSQRGKQSFEETALAVTELIGPEKAKLALMETGEPFVAPDGTAYAFRVAAVEPNHEPATLEEVKGPVMTDLKRAKAFEMARDVARKVLDAAEKRDLKDAAAELKVKTADSDWVPQERFFQLGQQIVTMPPSMPGVGANRVVVSESFRMAAEKKRLSLVTLADEKMAVVIELLGHKPPREALFDLMRPRLAQQVGRQLVNEALRQALDPESIQRRMALVLSVPDDYHLARNVQREYQDTGGDY